MKKSSKILSLFFGLIIAVLVLAPLAVQAASVNSSSDSPGAAKFLENTENRIERAEGRAEKLEQKREERALRATERLEKRVERLSEKRLEVCEKRAEKISNRVDKVLERGGKLNSGHLKIQERVEEFYQNRLLPDYPVIGYVDLVADMETKKAIVEDILVLAGESGPVFDCSSDDPVGQINLFKEDLKGLIDANKEYRTSVHTFVSAVLEAARVAKADKDEVKDAMEPEDTTPTVTSTPTPTPIEDEGGVE